MKKLSLLMFAILILGCGNETTVVEEPEPVAEEPSPVVMEPELIGHPLVADSNVKNGAVNVDPATLNSRGFYFKFTKPFYRYWVWLYKKDSTYLHWDSRTAGEWGRRDFVWINQILDHDPLQYNTEYELMISAQNYDCDYTEIVIQFRTKPQPNLVEKPEPVRQERTSVVALDERFRFEPGVPLLRAADVFNRDDNVDPEPLNANGIQFEFDEPIRKYKMGLRIKKGGASLGWFPRDLAERENMDRRIQIMPAEGVPLLEFDTEYVIDIFVQDFHCWTNEFEIRFHTKPKP